jgi:hypothetical protein
MKLGRTTVFGISALALSIGAAFAGEDSTHRWHSTGPEWHESADLATFNDADSNPENFSDPVVIGNEPQPAHENVTATAVEPSDSLTVLEPSEPYEPTSVYTPEPVSMSDPAAYEPASIYTPE